MANLYYVVYPSSAGTPTAAQVKSGWVGTAVTSATETSPTVTTTPFTFAADATGLTPATSYKLAVVWSDGATDSNVVESASFLTLTETLTALTAAIQSYGQRASNVAAAVESSFTRVSSIAAAISTAAKNEPAIDTAVSQYRKSQAGVESAIQAKLSTLASIDSVVRSLVAAASSVQTAVSSSRQDATLLHSAVEAVMQATSVANAVVQAKSNQSNELTAQVQAGNARSILFDAAIVRTRSAALGVHAVVSNQGSAATSLRAAVSVVSTLSAVLGGYVQAGYTSTGAVAAAIRQYGFCAAALSVAVTNVFAADAAFDAAVAVRKIVTAELDVLVIRQRTATALLSMYVADGTVDTTPWKIAIVRRSSAIAAGKALATVTTAIRIKDLSIMYRQPCEPNLTKRVFDARDYRVRCAPNLAVDEIIINAAGIEVLCEGSGLVFSNILITESGKSVDFFMAGGDVPVGESFMDYVVKIRHETSRALNTVEQTIIVRVDAWQTSILRN